MKNYNCFFVLILFLVISLSPAISNACDTNADPDCVFKDEIKRSFVRMFTSPSSPFMNFGRKTGGTFTNESQPNVELINADDEIIVKIELPGINKDDIKLNLYEEYLEIKAEREKKKIEEGDNYHLSEISYGSISRVISFPAKVDIEEAETEYKNGVLIITTPKIEPKKPRYRKLEV